MSRRISRGLVVAAMAALVAGCGHDGDGGAAGAKNPAGVEIEAPLQGEAGPDALATSGVRTLFGAPRAAAVSGMSVQIPPITFPKFCPPKFGAGDRDFAGHGPAVKIDVRLVYRKGGPSLDIVTTFSARETQGDWTEVKGQATRSLGWFPAGIDRLYTPGTFSFIYTDTDQADDEYFFGTSGFTSLVQLLTATGDTSGDDVGETGLKMRTNDIWLTLCGSEGCSPLG